MADFTSDCKKCGSKMKWNQSFDPPEGTTRAKEGKKGWWEVDGKIHDEDACKQLQSTKQGSPTASNGITFTSDIILQNVVHHPTLDSGANLALQAIEAAEQMMNTLYQSKVPDNLKGQIRNALTQNILLGQQNIILRDGFTAINEKVAELVKKLDKASN